MEWITGEISRSSHLSPDITLYRVNDDIYDEIIYKDGAYKLIRRCGIENYSVTHNHEIYITNKKILVYPLEDYLITEEEINLDALKSQSETTSISITNGDIFSMPLTLDVDKRYIEFTDLYEGNSFSLNTQYLDESRTSYIYRIKNNLPHELLDNDNFVNNQMSPPNIIIEGYSEQKVDKSDNGTILSPSINSPSSIKFIGNKNGEVYEIPICSEKVAAINSKNKWYCKQYNACGYTLQSIDGKTPVDEYEYEDSKLNITSMGRKLTDNYTLYAYTYINSLSAATYSGTLSADDSLTVYVNGKQVAQNPGLSGSKVLINFKKGWNLIEAVLQEGTGNDGFKFNPMLSSQDFVGKLCYYFTTSNDSCTNIIISPSFLNAVGSYKDKLYRDTDNIWKIQSLTGEYKFTGTENIQLFSSSDSHNVFTMDYLAMEDIDNKTIISNCFYGLSYTDMFSSEITGCNISYGNGKVYFSLPSDQYSDVNSVLQYFSNNNVYFYYVLPEPIIVEVLSQEEMNNIAYMVVCNETNELFVKDFEEIVPVVIDYSTSFLHTCYKFLIPVDECITYILNRPVSGDTCIIRYYDKNKNIIGYSNYLDTSSTTFEISIPENCYYINILDATNSENYNYSLIEVDTYNLDDTSISNLQITIDGNTSILNLPHILYPGDELVYDIDYGTWIYYPLSLDEDFIYYPSFEIIPLVKSNTNISCQTGIKLTAAINCIDTRVLSKPVNITINDDVYSGDHGYGEIFFDEVPGATEYLIYVDGELVASVDNEPYGEEYYSFDCEQMGSVTIMGFNDFLSSELSDSVYIQTVPNSPILESVDTVYENNRYYVTVKFIANSKIADTYDIIYSIDGSNAITTKMEHDKIYGSEKEYTFNAPSINKEFVIQLTSSNQTGRNDYIDAVTLVTNSGFSLWTYKTSINEILLAWIDEFEDEEHYSLKYSINNGQWMIIQSDGKSGIGTRLLEYLPLGEDDTMRVCLAVIRDGYTNIYSKPITVSKALDSTLVPPANFAGTKLDTGEIQFSWEDNYNVDASFELYYKYSDGTSQTIIIPKESSTTGNYTYIYNVQTFGFVTARIRMIWELGESEYSEDIIVYNIPVVSEAPSMHPKKRENNKLVIEWDIYDFIQTYVLYFTVDGVQTTIEQVDSKYVWDIPLDKEVISINAYVKALFIDGTYTNISSSISFKICNTSSIMESMIYTHNEFDNDIYTTVMSKDLITPYDVYTYSMNSFVNEYSIYERTYSSFLFTDYQLYESYWGHGIGNSYELNTTIMNSISQVYSIITKIYGQVFNNGLFETTIYTSPTITYNVYTEIVKVTIACLGDSITAGHPNFWAETGTGLINSQYEYWLDRRLKNEFNVVNKGYGQEKTADMLERFDRDILPLEPRYCIILGGTNDYVNTYIVRYGWKLRGVCF